MKILLTTLNAKYVHTALGLWYIYQYCHPEYPELMFKEYNINQELSWVCGELYLEKPKAIAFSCNIWNIEATLTICRWLKQVEPEITVVLGGPEVWSEPVAIMEQNPAVDFIIVGEGELTFKEWLDHFHRTNPDWKRVKGLVFRTTDGIVQNELRPDISDLSILPRPYPEELSDFRQKLLYYETTRGCPYQCQYCLSANEKGVRYFPLEQVKNDLLHFINSKIAQVKFVDRSFNCNPKWAKEIWRFLLEHPGETNFHFEVVADLLDEESIAILQQAPPGAFQFEIGVQSTNPETIRLIQRKMDFSKLAANVTKLVQTTNVFIHLDLIAGLPAEDYASFKRSFNETIRLRPHRLQLGFLKLLKGSGLRNKIDEYRYEFTHESPYEILSSQWLTYQEILKLKTVEDLLEKYYNSGRFKLSLEYLFSRFKSEFELLEQFADWWKAQQYDQFSHKSKDLYGYLLQFYESLGKDSLVFRNLLKYDLLTQERMVELPEWTGGIASELKNFGYEFWKDPTNIEKYIPELSGLSIRDIQRRVLFADFAFDPIQVKLQPWLEPEQDRTVILFVYGKNIRNYRIETTVKSGRM